LLALRSETISRDLLLIADDVIEYTGSDDPFCSNFMCAKYTTTKQGLYLRRASERPIVPAPILYSPVQRTYVDVASRACALGDSTRSQRPPFFRPFQFFDHTRWRQRQTVESVSSKIVYRLRASVFSHGLDPCRSRKFDPVGFAL